MKQIIGFFGGDSQTGVSMIAWAFADRLSERGQRVLLVLGSGKDDQVLFPTEGGHSIDELKAGLRSGKVEREEVFQILEKRRNLWILPGVINFLAAGQFLEDTFAVLLDGLQEDFDYVVIDGGCDVKLGLTVSALNTCTSRYFVVTQQSKVLHRFLRCRQQFLDPLKLESSVILNMYRKDPAIFLKNDICRMLEGIDVNMIPYIEEGWQCEMERKNLLFVPRFSNAIDDLVNVFEKGGRKARKWKKPFR